MAAAMARRTRTSSSGFLPLLMARMVLAREPATITWYFGLALNCATLRGVTRGKASTSPASRAATWAAGSEMKRKVARLILMALASR
ncbi:hypothetical protein D3C71_1282320 [compost metagenome]